MSRDRKTIALVFPTVPFMSRALTEGVIECHLQQQDWTVIELPYLGIGKSPMAGAVRRLDGAIIRAEPRDQWVRQFLAQGVRVVNCGTEWSGIEGIASVHIDYDDLDRVVVRHLQELGLKRVVAMGHQLDQRPATQRVLDRFAQAAEGAGMQARVWDLGGKDSPALVPRRLLEPEKEKRLAVFLAELEKPAAIFCASDHMGFIVCEVASLLGLRIPEDLAVVGQGDNPQACFSNPPLTSVTGPMRAVGRAAADCLACWLDGGERPAANCVIPGASLVTRESTLGKSGNVTLEALRRYIADNAANGLSQTDLVAMSGISIKTLVRQYTEAFGLGPGEEILVRRLAEARRLLEQTDLPLVEIAAACGFTSQSGFSNYFRRHAGCPPSDFRKK